MEFEVVVYWYDGAWKCWNLQDPEKKFTESILNINNFFAASTLIGRCLNIIKSSNIEQLSHFTEQNFAKLTLYLSHYCFTVSNKIYLPVNSLNYPCIDLPQDYFIPELEERYNMLIGYTNKEHLGEFTAFLQSSPLEIKSFTQFPNPEYALLLLEDYEPWPGILEGLYGGFFKQGVEKWNFYYCPRNQFPDDETLNSVKGVVITGGVYSANDELEWIDRLSAFMIRAEELGIRNVSICLSHQIAAKAFGGAAGKNPNGEYIYKISEIYKSTIMNGLPSTLVITETHGDCVTQLPLRGEVLYSSSDCVVEVMKIGENLLSFQGHPEFTPHFIKHFHSIFEKNSGLIPESLYHSILASNTLSDSDKILHHLNNFLRKLI